MSASVNLPLHQKSRSSILAPAHTGGPGKRAVKRMWYLFSYKNTENQKNFNLTSSTATNAYKITQQVHIMNTQTSFKFILIMMIPAKMTNFVQTYNNNTTTTTVLRPFVQDYPGELLPEEAFTHPPS